MSAWVEVDLKGNYRGYVRADSVVAVIAPRGGDDATMATGDSPITLVLSGGETFPPVIATSVSALVVHLAGARIIHKNKSGAAPATIVRPADGDRFYAALTEALMSEYPES